jgi:hypothetical protein
MLIILNGFAAIRKHYIGCSISDHYSKNTPIVQGEYNYFLAADNIVSRVTKNDQEIYNRDDDLYQFTVIRDGKTFIFAAVDDTTQQLVKIEEGGEDIWLIGDENTYTTIDLEDFGMDGFIDDAENEVVGKSLVETLNEEFGVIDTGYDLSQDFSGVVLSEKVHSGLYFDNIFEDTGLGDPVAPSENYDEEWIKLQESLDNTRTNIVTGVFAPFYINKMINEYSGDTKVINIIRNPTVSYLMDDSHLVNDGISNGESTHPDGTRIAQCGDTLFSSIINSALVKMMPTAQTIRFEDIISTGTITIDDVSVSVVEFENYNGIITQYEKDNLVTLVSKDKQDSLSNFVTTFTNLAEMYPGLPNDIYVDFSYEPLSYDEIYAIGP